MDINPFYTQQARYSDVNTREPPLIFLTEVLSILSAKKNLTLGGGENFGHVDRYDEVVKLQGRFANAGDQ
jgi:hypothetical protein